MSDKQNPPKPCEAMAGAEWPKQKAYLYLRSGRWRAVVQPGKGDLATQPTERGSGQGQQ